MAIGRRNFESINPSMIQAWRDEVSRLDAEIKDKQQEVKECQNQKDKINQLIQAATALLPASSVKSMRKKRRYLTSHAITIPQTKQIPKNKSTNNAKVDKRIKKGSWTNTLLGILEDNHKGMTYNEVRKALENTHLADKLANTDKSFYGAILKLTTKKKIIKHNGRVYSLDAFAQFQRDVASGATKDIPVSLRRGNRSPTMEAIISFLKSNPNGAEAKEINNMLNKNEQIRPSLENKSYIYNVLANLKNKKEIKKDGRLYYAVS